MGWGTVSAPGTEHGPCGDGCQHTDCAATRKMAESKCIICEKEIGYDTSFYVGDEKDTYQHAACLWEKIEEDGK